MPKINIPLYHRLYEDIKDKIIHNEYKKNSKLESIRSLSSRLDISTTTVEKAYNQLLVEGYIKSIPRSGFVVMDVNNLSKGKFHSYIDPIEHPVQENNKLTSDLFDVNPIELFESYFKTVPTAVFMYPLFFITKPSLELKR